MNSPNVELTRKLTQIWERLLGRSPIGGDESFFDLGGGPALAHALCAEIARAGERELPPLILYQAPTIRTLAAVLRQGSPARILPLVLLKAGDPALEPVFITHGIGSTVMEFFDFVKHIETSRPIYGIQAKGLDGMDEPLDTVEGMAEYFLGAVKALQPRGPYLLMGYSFGGIVTLEMARRLRAAGDEIGLLALLETYPHKSCLALGPRMDLFLRLVRYHLGVLWKLPLRNKLSYIAGKATKRGGDPDEVECPAGMPSPTPAAKAIGLTMHRSGFLALKRYRPARYDGRVKFVRAKVSRRFPKNAKAVWAKVLPGLELETAPGDHQGILTEYSESLASVLSRYLKEVSAQEHE